MADELPELLLNAHPELRAVGEALAQHRRGEVVSARCPKCDRALVVTEIVATKTTMVACPDGHTRYRPKHE